ncbi:MAG: bifunctional metallophosphatase/5'-nucleotidase [Armatimonadetes bacterium]|nr:bifunctional metallophosphatase/5'-nucleotidase [Armatimonadota bacterium]
MDTERFRLRALLAVLLCLSALGPVWGAAGGAHLVVLHLNDVHGQLEPGVTVTGESVGGMARVATLVRQVRAENPDRVLLLHAGDILSRGDALTVHDGGALSFRLLEMIGVDALVPGNGEFYFGLDNLMHLTRHARVPVLFSNLARRSDGKRPFGSFVVKRVGGVTVGILGLGFIRVEHPASRTLELRDAIAEARQRVPELRPRVDLLIALTHIGFGADQKLAAEVPELDLVVGGHSHTRLLKPRRVPRTGAPGEVVVVQAGELTRDLGRVDIDLEPDGSRMRVARIEAKPLPVNAEVPEDPRIAAALKKARAPMERVIFESEVALANPKEGEIPAGQFVAEVVRREAGADLALLDRGSVAGDIRPGKNTWADIYRIHPWRNRVLLLTSTGAQVVEALAKLDAHSGGCMFGKEKGAVRDMVVGGRALEPEKHYRLAVDHYLYGTIPMLQAIPSRDTGQRIDTLLVRHLKRVKVLRTAPTGGRKMYANTQRGPRRSAAPTKTLGQGRCSVRDHNAHCQRRTPAQPGPAGFARARTEPGAWQVTGVRGRIPPPSLARARLDPGVAPGPRHGVLRPGGVQDRGGSRWQ